MEFEYAGIPIIAMLSALLEILKRNGYLRKETIPLVSIFLGILAGVFLFSNGDLKVGIVQGIWIGLAPMGLYEGIDSLRD